MRRWAVRRRRPTTDPGGPRRAAACSARWVWAAGQISDSEFELNRGSRGGILSLWSRSSRSQFSGLEDALSLNSDVRTTMVGADYTHKTPAVVRWLVAHPRFDLHLTPTYASWLNLVERWFAALTTSQLRRGIYRSVVALERAIREFLAAHNATGRPFVWTKSADEVLANIARFAQRTPTALAG